MLDTVQQEKFKTIWEKGNYRMGSTAQRLVPLWLGFNHGEDEFHSMDREVVRALEDCFLYPEQRIEKPLYLYLQG